MALHTAEGLSANLECHMFGRLTGLQRRQYALQLAAGSAIPRGLPSAAKSGSWPWLDDGGLRGEAMQDGRETTHLVVPHGCA